ncbi:pathogenesis-related protein 1A1-like [Beta vulgaris subsp. vulgaris]|uniref:pathogenesis-related protein 1A1-like n=1 Tax=Beta vulgaris subsp. vulgaris TaxID=3555 RepID=UPI002546C65A|nr:pathogenesis-related protein 1A1-like [Beta vulgaris subsp. vulgaris]
MKLFVCLLCIIFFSSFLKSHAEDDQKQFLEAHNTVRAQVGVAPLVWNQTLASFAQQFADKVKQKCDNTMKSGGPYGENTAGGYAAFRIIDAVSQWVQQKENYDQQSNVCKNGKECKQYKQVVCKESKYIGCATILCGAGWPFVVCEYDPPCSG